MIDFLKSGLLTTPDHLLTNPNLKFVSRLDETTGEVIPNRHGYFTRVAEFGQLKIKITQNKEERTTSKLHNRLPSTWTIKVMTLLFRWLLLIKN
jgi:hypothetical protein